MKRQKKQNDTGKTSKKSSAAVPLADHKKKFDQLLDDAIFGVEGMKSKAKSA